MIAFYPGAFKPPHRGHFNVVKSLLNGSYNGSIYDKDNYKETGASLLGGNQGKKPKIDKVIVFVGAGERNGITKEESMSIWEIYSNYLPNVEIVDGGSNPMFAAKDYAQDNPEEEFVSVTGIRGEKDFVDLRRVTTYKNAPNVKGLALAAAPGSVIRATDFRNKILSGNLDKILDFFPEELSREEILGILMNLKDKIVAEVLSSNIDGFISEYFAESVEEQTEPALSLKDYIGSLLEYMLDNRMNILPLPEVKTINDPDNSANFFGRTAYYTPTKKEIVLYIHNRHPKDIVRSFAHEMIHHIQNLEGKLGNITTTNTNESDYLEELEKEAYLLGNITFRNWEDSIKSLDESLWTNISESKQVGTLYHYTSANGLKGILQSNSIKASEEYYLGNDLYFVSFTRNKNFHKKDSTFDVSMDYRIALDGNKLSNKYKITPFAYIPGWNYKDNWEYDWLDDEPESVVRDFLNATGDYDEQEERINFKKPSSSITDIKDYILKIDKVSELTEGRKKKKDPKKV